MIKLEDLKASEHRALKQPSIDLHYEHNPHCWKRWRGAITVPGDDLKLLLICAALLWQQQISQ